jgi:RHS repeat-associated protein
MVVDGVAAATPTLSAVHVDHLMRPVRLTSAAKAAVWDAVWLPWGGAHVTSGTAAMNLRFPGQYFLVEQGLAYNWHRNYDQTTARYTQPDPLGFPDGPARYAYAANNPMAYVDPLGLAPKLPDSGLPQGWPEKNYPSLPLSDDVLRGKTPQQLQDMYNRLKKAGLNKEAEKIREWQKRDMLRNKKKQRGGPKMRGPFWMQFVPDPLSFMCSIDPSYPGCELANYSPLPEGAFDPLSGQCVAVNGL